MSKITLLTGLPASGKSTWAKSQLNPVTVRVNLDDIRAMMGFGSGETFSKELEKIALKTQDQLILSAIGQDKNVIVDNTHIGEAIPKRIKRLFDGDVPFFVKSFRTVPLLDCISRDSERDNPVGEKVIRKMHSRLHRFDLTEEYMNDVVLSPSYVPDLSKPKAIVCDLDGTLFRHVARSPYEYTKVYTDVPDPFILNMLHMYKYQGYEIVFLSGRPEKVVVAGVPVDVRGETTRCLFDKAQLLPVGNVHLFMRPEGDNGNDADVKQMLFDKYVRYNFEVSVWLDDRNRVVRRIRKLGVNVHQVAEGDF